MKKIKIYLAKLMFYLFKEETMELARKETVILETAAFEEKIKVRDECSVFQEGEYKLEKLDWYYNKINFDDPDEQNDYDERKKEDFLYHLTEYLEVETVKYPRAGFPDEENVKLTLYVATKLN